MRTILNFPFLLLCILSYNISFGADIKWIGGVGNWNVASNWEGGVVPGINDEVQIETSGDTVTILNGVTAEVLRIFIHNGAVVKNFGTIISGGSSFSEISVFIGRLENDGSIIVTEDTTPNFDCISVGNSGVFVNRGSVLLDLVVPGSDTNGSGISNNGSLINESGGTITINDATQFAMQIGASFASDPITINHGVITINRTQSIGIWVQDGSFENDGDIFFNDTGTNELYSEFGALRVDGSSTTFTNTGRIVFVDPIFPAIISTSDNEGFVNAGTIEIEIVDKQWIPSESFLIGDLIVNSGLFRNTEDGIIDILIAGGCNSGVFTLENNGNLINEGLYTVTFTSGGSCGGISNLDNFTNTGEIVVDVEAGFVNGNLLSNTGVNAIFDNNGTLNLDNLNGSGFGFGIFNGQGAVFNNFSSIEATGINNFGTRSALVNNGSILSTSAISNSGQFENTTGGTIELEQVVSNRFISLTNGEFSPDFDEDEVGFFTNDGNIFIRGNQAFTSGSSGIRSNIGSTFINNGTVEMTDLHFTGINIGFAANDQPPVFINNGSLTVDGVNGNGMDISSGSFVNNNSLHIMNCDQSAIRSPGSASFTNAGVIEIDGNIGNDALIISGSGFVNDSSGSIIIRNASKIDGFPSSFGSAILLQGQLTNRGSIRIENDIQGPGIKIRFTPNLFNNEASGEIFINDTGEGGINIERGEFNNSGKIIFGSNIALEAIIGPRPFNNLPTGELWGDGVIDGSIFTNQGSLNPGFSPGIFEITDLYDHTEGKLNIEIAGTNGPGSDTGHDQIQVTDSVILGGTCVISFINDFEPQLGDAFVLMTSTEVITGEFDAVNLDLDTASWEIIYNSNEVILSIFNIPPVFTSVPIDSTLEDELYEYNITATDQNDQNSLSITSSALPSWLELTDNGNGSALLTGTPENDDVGEYEITLQVQDGFGATDLQTFTLTVENVNDAPVFVSDPIDSVNENENYLYEIVTEDVDVGDELEIIPILIPVWLDFNDDGDGTASLTGTAPGDGPDEYEVLLTVFDLSGETAVQAFTITIIRENRIPEFTSSPVETATEDEIYFYNIAGTDEDGNDGLTITSNELPSWLELIDNGQGSALLIGTPANDDVGITDVILILTDQAGAVAEQSFQVNVINTNDPPEFTSEPVRNVAEEELYTYNIITEDPDEGDQLTLSSATLPDWLVLTDNGDGSADLFGTPPLNAEGLYSIELFAEDLDGAGDQQTFILTVGNINQPPFFTSTPVLTAIEDEAYNYDITASDPDGNDILNISASDLPVWLTFIDNGNGTASLNGIPSNDDVGSVSVELVVTDSEGAFEIQAFQIEVINVNDPPEFTSEPIRNVAEEELYTYNIITEDPDEGDQLTISSATLPDWLVLTDNGDGSADLIGTPPLNAEGLYSIELFVEDREGASDQQSFTLTVGNINQPPFFTSAPVLTANEDEAYNYDIATSDPDVDDVLTITASELPDWLNFTDNSDGTSDLSGIPSNDDVGSITVELVVTDNEGASETQTFQIEVININDPPQFVSTPIEVVTENELYSYFIEAEDIDAGDELIISASLLPTWLSLTDNGDGTATLSGTPTSNDVGTHEVQLIVTDPGNTNDAQQFTVNVINFNQPPAFESTPIETAIEDELYFYEILVSDPDAGDDLEISSSDLPEWLSLENDNHGLTTLSGTPVNEDVGVYQITLKVIDSKNAETSQEFSLEVINVNDPPVFTSQPITLIGATEPYVYEIIVSDPDLNDELTITGELLPNGLQIIDRGNGSATLSGQVTGNIEGTEKIIIRVEDSRGEFALQEFELLIQREEEEIFQTALTPNGDGLNDTWRIETISGCQDCQVQVFNRWGQKVFSSIGYAEEWDGTSGNQELPTGTYYYVIDRKNGQESLTGTIAILK